MKLLPLLWLLCGLLLVVGDQDPPVAPAPAPKAPSADNSTVAAQGKLTSAAASSGATGTPLPPAGSAAGKVQTSDQSAPKATKIEPQQPPKEAEKTPAASENAGKNRGRTDTGSPKAAGETPVAATTAKPAVVESKASTSAAGAGAAAAPLPASLKPKANDTAPVLSTSTKASTSTTAKPAAGSAIVSEGQSMKDVTKPTNSTGNSTTNSNTTSTMASTKTTVKTTPKPTKPPVVYSMGTHSEWEKDQEQGKDGGKPPLPKPVSTLAEPVTPQVQELTGNLSDRGDTGYVVPIVTVLLTVPLAIGVVTIMYRRFRDMWSTRHYRRMDFLVDGMYND